MTDTSSSRIEDLITQIKTKLKSGVDESIQKDLARLIKLLPDLSTPEHEALISTAEITVEGLIGDGSSPKLASDLLDSLELRLRRARNPIILIIRGGSPAARVVFGLGMLLYFAIPLAVALWPFYSGVETILGINAHLFGLVVAGGMLGSCVSIMVRINDFNTVKDADPTVLFLTGFFKPAIGASFALFIFSVISAGIIPLSIKAETSNYFFAALSFLAGFSERLARDVVTKAEGIVSGATNGKA